MKTNNEKIKKIEQKLEDLKELADKAVEFVREGKPDIGKYNTLRYLMLRCLIDIADEKVGLPEDEKLRISQSVQAIFNGARSTIKNI